MGEVIKGDFPKVRAMSLDDHWPVLLRELETELLTAGLAAECARSEAEKIVTSCQSFVEDLLKIGYSPAVALKASTRHLINETRRVILEARG